MITHRLKHLPIYLWLKENYKSIILTIFTIFAVIFIYLNIDRDLAYWYQVSAIIGILSLVWYTCETHMLRIDQQHASNLSQTPLISLDIESIGIDKNYVTIKNISNVVAWDIGMEIFSTNEYDVHFRTGRLKHLLPNEQVNSFVRIFNSEGNLVDKNIFSFDTKIIANIHYKNHMGEYFRAQYKWDKESGLRYKFTERLGSKKYIDQDLIS